MLALAGGVAFEATLTGRLAVDSARRRVAAMRGGWTARGCLARLRAQLEERLLQAGSVPGHSQLWRDLPSTFDGVARSSAGECTVVFEPEGVRLDANDADRAMLQQLVRVAAPRADAIALSAAIVTARPFRARESLQAIAGIAAAPELLSLLDVENGRVSIMHAPPAVLASLPGFDAEVVAFMLARRRMHPVPLDLVEIAETAPPRVRARLFQSLSAIVEHATLEPAGWNVLASVLDRASGATTTVEQRFRRFGTDVMVTRERTW